MRGATAPRAVLIGLLYHVCSTPAAAPTSREGACRTRSSRARTRPTPSGRGDRRRRDPHDGDRRARRRRRARAHAGSQNPESEVSAHYCVDADTIDPVRARGATSPGTRAAGTRTRSGSSSPASPASAPLDWSDAYSRAVLERAARLTAEVCARYGIPMRRLRAADLVAGPARRHGSRRRERGLPQERPLGSGPRLPLGAVPAAQRAAATSSSAPARPEAISSSSARVITSGGEIWRPPPTRVRVSTPWWRALKRDAVGEARDRRRAAPGRSAPRRRRRSRLGSRSRARGRAAARAPPGSPSRARARGRRGPRAR